MIVLETTSAVVGLALPAIKLIEKILQAAPKATQNKAECDDLEGRLSVLRKLLLRLRLEGPEAPEALCGLCDALREAHELVDACQNGKHAFSGDLAERFSRVNRRIDSHLILIQLCSRVDDNQRFDQIIPPASTSVVAADVYKVSSPVAGLLLQLAHVSYFLY
jgi:hypothetical protein